MADPKFWRDLQVQFRNLHGRLTAFLEYGRWTLELDEDSRDEGLRRTFRTLAERAACAAGYRPDDALQGWLSLLHERSPESFTPSSAYKGEEEYRRRLSRKWRRREHKPDPRPKHGGVLHNAIANSILVCMELETKAWAQNHDASPVAQVGPPQAPTPTRPPGKETLTVKEMAKVLSVSTDTIYRWIKNRQVKASRLPGARSIRIATAEVIRIRKNDAYLK